MDKILGLEMGADDYMTKPFSPRELSARVKTVMRRVSEKAADEKVVHIGKLAINKETYSVTKGDKSLELSSTEFRLLLYLSLKERGRFSLVISFLMRSGRMSHLSNRGQSMFT